MKQGCAGARWRPPPESTSRHCATAKGAACSVCPSGRLQPDAHFGRILAAYGGVFVAGSLARGMALDGFRPDRWDVIGALICLAGVGVIMYAPRGC